MPTHYFAAGYDSASIKGYSFDIFQNEAEFYEGGGLVLLSSNGVTGMAHPWILSCAPTFTRPFYDRRVRVCKEMDSERSEA